MLCAAKNTLILFFVIDIRVLNWTFSHTILFFALWSWLLLGSLIDEACSLRIIETPIYFDILVLITIRAVGSYVTIVFVIAVNGLTLMICQRLSLACHVVQTFIKSETFLHAAFERGHWIVLLVILTFILVKIDWIRIEIVKVVRFVFVDEYTISLLFFQLHWFCIFKNALVVLEQKIQWTRSTIWLKFFDYFWHSELMV